MVYIVICNEVFTQDSEPDLSKGSEGRTNDALVELQVEWRADTLKLSLMLDCTWPVRHTSFFLDVQK